MSAGWFRKLTVAGPATFKSSITTTTAALAAKSLTLAGGGIVEAVETKTAPAALALFGVSLINATTNGTTAFTLGPPGTAGIGQVKTIIWAANALSTRVITVATTATLYNSSAKTFATVTGKTRLLNAPPYCRLVGVTATKWAVTGVNLSSAMTLA